MSESESEQEPFRFHPHPTPRRWCADVVTCGEAVRFAKPVTITGFELVEAGSEDAPGRDGWLPVEWGGVTLRVRLIGEDGRPIPLRPETGGAFRVVGRLDLN